jgi:hypothetical protein
MVRRFARLARSSLEPLALFSATLVVYYPAWQGSVLWDDNAHLTRPDLQSTAGLWRIWFDLGATQQYYPATHSAFWLMHRLWGDATLGYHLVNIALHAASALLLKTILSRLAIPGAFLAAVLFALHPVAVESVAWMTELKNTLSTAFCLSAALCYLRFDDRRRTSARSSFSSWRSSPRASLRFYQRRCSSCSGGSAEPSHGDAMCDRCCHSSRSVARMAWSRRGSSAR